MNEQDKVTVDDIIGIVKTEEQTNSVEEVRKLRGRGNETAKRFSYKLDEIFDEGNHFAYALSKENAEDIVELLNELHEENQQLKQELKNGICSLCGARVSKCGGLK